MGCEKAWLKVKVGRNNWGWAGERSKVAEKGRGNRSSLRERKSLFVSGERGDGVKNRLSDLQGGTGGIQDLPELSSAGAKGRNRGPSILPGRDKCLHHVFWALKC